MTLIGKKEFVLYLRTQDERSSQSEATIGRAHWQANHGRMRKWVIGLPLATERTQEPLPARYPDYSQSSEPPLFTKGLRFYPKLRNIFEIPKLFHKKITSLLSESENGEVPLHRFRQASDRYMPYTYHIHTIHIPYTCHTLEHGTGMGNACH